jgi:Cys-rich protein (TIGR01571 family)
MNCGFQQDLFGCTEDVSSCLIVWCLPGGICCIQAQAVGRATGEGQYVPYCLICCCGVLGGAINRGTIRSRLGIDGSCPMDCVIWCLVPHCAACQEYREVMNRVPAGQGLNVVIVQNY